MSTAVKQFDPAMYAATLAYYGLPPKYNRTFKSTVFTDRKTNVQKTSLVSCNVAQESRAGFAVWTQVNQPREGTALTAKGKPKKASNGDIGILANITADYEYPQNPSLAYEVGNRFNTYLIEQGLAAHGTPVEASGAGPHHVLPLVPIEITTSEEAERWNKAVAIVVNQHMKPAFARICDEVGVEMDLEGFDISRILSAPGTWRPSNPAKPDCEALKQGYLRHWLPPYTDGNYPIRQESKKLTDLVKAAYADLVEQEKADAEAKQRKAEQKAKAYHTSTHLPPANGNTTLPSQWITDYVSRGNLTGNRSSDFHKLVTATYLKFDEDTVWNLKEEINSLSGSKYNGRLDREIERSLGKAQSIPKNERNGRTAKQVEVEERHYDWQEKEETPEERNSYLQSLAEQAKTAIDQHICSRASIIKVFPMPPGVGKSNTVYELGNEGLDIAAIVERHEQITSVRPFDEYRIIQPCTEDNCPYASIANELARHGYNGNSVHELHDNPCDYHLQFREGGSAVYQIPHAKTIFPARHEAMIVDEWNLARWIERREITINMLNKASNHYENTEYTFLCALVAVVTHHQRTYQGNKKHTGIWGKALFDELNDACKGHLEEWINSFFADKELMTERPFTPIDLYQGKEKAEEQAKNKPDIILPFIVKTVYNELERWKSGHEWNSLMEVKHSQVRHSAENVHTFSFFVSSKLTLPLHKGVLKPSVILDATADVEILKQHFGLPIESHEKGSVVPPRHMQHVAVRTGKRYGKRELCTERKDGKENEELARAIAECKFLLNQMDPDRKKIVGVVTYDGCKGAIGEALNIPEERCLHFWGCRGSNRLEQCDILFIVGTPTLSPDETLRLARVLYSDDLEPLIETAKKTDGTWVWEDTRVEKLSRWLIESELTQCAHRNRPLRYDGRIVISLCSEPIDFLPITRVYNKIPHLTADGTVRSEATSASDETRIKEAIERIVARGEKVTNRRLAEESHIAYNVAGAYLKKYKTENETKNPIDTITYRVFSFISENDPYRVLGTVSDEPSNNHVSSSSLPSDGAEIPYRVLGIMFDTESLTDENRELWEHYLRALDPFLECTSFVTRYPDGTSRMPDLATFKADVWNALTATDASLTKWAHDTIQLRIRMATASVA